MKNKSSNFFLAGLFLILQACNTPSETQTVEPITAIPPTEIPAATAVQHTLIPVNLPGNDSGIAADQDSSRTSADQSASGGDRFSYGEYERPFNSVTMDTYFSNLDIVQYSIQQDDLWIYANIVVRSASTDGTMFGQYALEIDNDEDGKGDWLIIATAPASTDWANDNVQVWNDSNKDVGGSQPVVSDKNPGFGDGYDTNVFNNGSGDDVDAAWTRKSPDNQNAVQIAVKRTLVDDDGKYIAGVWAGSKIDPAMFDFNDKMSQEQAGAAVKSFAYYPIQGLSKLDNACRVVIGGPVLSNNDLGLCEVITPQQAAPGEPAPGQPGPSCQETKCDNGYGFDAASCQCVLLAPP